MVDVANIAPEKVRTFSRAEFDKMVTIGLFDEERVELLARVLVTMSPQGALRQRQGIGTTFTMLLRRAGNAS